MLLKGLKEAVKKLLLAWRANNGDRVWPARLFFYRDGVSEGQFAAVQMLEIPQIRMACEEVRFCLQLARVGLCMSHAVKVGISKCVISDHEVI